ncbi:Retrotransposon gag protein [Gossypium australe]|uniref:Retrotransposon gag protein n=1 Tax=Gossypium australe TaxID=47621 RepID=A0A5B6WAQ0_9ROSI|nr:Retrotransposon gag protein [Gossypium australe]
MGLFKINLALLTWVSMNLQYSDEVDLDSVICSTLRYLGVFDEAVKLLLIPFALGGRVEEWLELPPGTITSWEEFVQLFLWRLIPMPSILGTYEELLKFKQSPTEILGQA